MNNIEGDAKLSLIQVRLATTCEAIIGEFEDAELEVKKRVKQGSLKKSEGGKVKLKRVKQGIIGA